MAIVSSSVNAHDRGNGSLRVHERHTDQYGYVHELRYHAQVGTDVNANLSANALSVYESLKNAELENVEKVVSEGVDPNTITPLYVNGNRKLRAVVRAVMRSEAEKVLNSITYINAISDAVLDSLFTPAKRLKIRARILGLEAIKATLEADITQREEL